MKISLASPSQFLGQIGLVLAVVAVAGCGPGDLTTARTLAKAPLPVATANAAPADDAHCANVAPTYALLLEKAGNFSRLGYFGGCGWKYLGQDGNVALHPTVPGAPSAPASSDPMSVFIDGPTGYAFAWTAGASWEFIGEVTDGSTQLHLTQQRVSQR